MPYYPPKAAAFDPDAKPQKIKCGSQHVFGWLYPDGTVELICRAKGCHRPGHETRHLYNPENDLVVTCYVVKPDR